MASRVDHLLSKFSNIKNIRIICPIRDPQALISRFLSPLLLFQNWGGEGMNTNSEFNTLCENPKNIKGICSTAQFCM